MSPEATPHKPDWLGGLIGIVVFLVGIGLIILSFRLAYDMFSVPPAQALNVGKDSPVQLNQTAQSFVDILGRILYLLVMVVAGSIIANRGIKLYSESRLHRPAAHMKEGA